MVDGVLLALLLLTSLSYETSHIELGWKQLMARSRRMGVISGDAPESSRLDHDEDVNWTTSVVTADIVTMASGKCSLSFKSSFACSCSAK